MIDNFKTTTSISRRFVSFCFSASQRKAKKKDQKLCDLCLPRRSGRSYWGDFAVGNLFRFSCFVVIPIRDASREFLTIYFNKAFDHEHGSESEVCYNEITYHFGVYP
jgi:RNA recognition motif-containing protein